MAFYQNAVPIVREFAIENASDVNFGGHASRRLTETDQPAKPSNIAFSTLQMYVYFGFTTCVQRASAI
jgi:hypothetical protein